MIPSVDAHHHLWDLSARPLPWLDDPSCAPLRKSFLPSDLRPLLDKVGVECSLAVEAATSVDETHWLLDIAGGNPWIIGVVGYLDIDSPALAEQIDRVAARPDGHLLVGVRTQVQSEPDIRWLERPEVRDGLGVLGDHGLTFDLVVVPRNWDSVLATVTACPDTTFVLDHLGKPAVARPDARDGGFEEWRAFIKALSAHPNVFVKVSGLTTEAGPDWTAEQITPWVHSALDAFGPSRCMIGSDWPVCTLAGTYGDTMSALFDAIGPLSHAERSALLGGTAHTAYRLSTVVESARRN